jgi:hypothetical protein
MKKLLYIFLCIFSIETFSQVPEQTTGDCTGYISGGSGVIKVVCNPNTIDSIKLIDQRFSSSVAWDTVYNVLYAYHSDRPVGKKWARKTPIQASVFVNATVNRNAQYWQELTVIGVEKGDKIMCDQTLYTTSSSGQSLSFATITATVKAENIVQIQIIAFGASQTFYKSVDFTVYKQ